MVDIATATLSGNLTRDPELRTLPSGTDVARLRVGDDNPSAHRRRVGRQNELLHRRGVRRPGAELRAVPPQGLTRVRRRRARLAGVDRPARQQARGRDAPRSQGRCSRAAGRRRHRLPIDAGEQDGASPEGATIGDGELAAASAPSGEGSASADDLPF